MTSEDSDRLSVALVSMFCAGVFIGLSAGMVLTHRGVLPPSGEIWVPAVSMILSGFILVGWALLADPWSVLYQDQEVLSDDGQ